MDELKELVEELHNEVTRTEPDYYWVQNHCDQSVKQEFVSWCFFQGIAAQIAEIHKFLENQSSGAFV